MHPPYVYVTRNSRAIRVIINKEYNLKEACCILRVDYTKCMHCAKIVLYSINIST